MNQLMRTLILLTVLAFSSIDSLYAQSKYLDSTRTTFSFGGSVGSSEDAFLTSIGGTLTLKGALDFGIQIGSVKSKKNITDDEISRSLVDEGSLGTSFSAQAYLYMLNQNRGNSINFGVSLGGSSIFYDEADLNSMVAGFHLSRRETEDDLTSVTFSFEPLFVIINELTITESGRTLTSQPFFSGSISIGFSKKLKDSKVFFFEPGIVYENESQSVFGGLTIGLIL